MAEEHNVEFLAQNMEGENGDVKAEEDKANDGDIESTQEVKVERHEEFSLSLHDGLPKNEITTHAGIKCERNEDVDVRDENKVEVTQRNEDDKNNIESSDNAGVGDENMEEASLPDAEVIVQTNTEDEEPGNELSEKIIYYGDLSKFYLSNVCASLLEELNLYVPPGP